MNPQSLDGQWLDFYALLDVPVSADEDTIRKRIGKVYSEAAANSDHRDLARRQYFQSLVERVLPQCRRVLLDAEWRAKYDRQHILHSIGDPAAQTYVAFVATMRGKDAVAPGAALPQRLLEDIQAARRVVECACQGAELDLLPSKAISSKEAFESLPALALRSAPEAALAMPVPRKGNSERRAASNALLTPAPIGAAPGAIAGNSPLIAAPIVAPPTVAAPTVAAPLDPINEARRPGAPSSLIQEAPPSAAPSAVAPSTVAPSAVAPLVQEIEQHGEPARAKVITAQEAAAIRRQRASNPDIIIGASSVASGPAKAPFSRVSVGEAPAPTRQRLISPTSMNLMVAIVGVLLTITIQKFASTPAVATSTGRMPIYVAVSSDMEGVLLRAETEWERTPEGASYDLVVQSVDSRTGLKRALGTDGPMPDAWIPSDSLWADAYNARAAKTKRAAIASDQSVAQTPMVLLARSDRAGELQRRFPDHQIPSWEALRAAIPVGAAGRFGLADPQNAATGAIARFSMAREWGAAHNQSAAQAARSPQFWAWMNAFEENAPVAPAQTRAMVKDLVLGTTGRFWWGIAYESDALDWMSQGKPLEIWYLPRTDLADHPFCAIERVGAPLEVAPGRASFQQFLRSPAMQKTLLSSGFRPTEVGLGTKMRDNPFLNPAFRARGARADGLPRDERPNLGAIEILTAQWAKRFD